MPSSKKADARGEVLVAIMNNKRDFAILQEQRWYRIPVDKAPKRWPPQVLAFWQTSVFGAQAFAVNYYGRVRDIQRVRRTELFPNEIDSARSQQEYYQLHLESVERLPNPITGRPRRVSFIPTTWEKFAGAAQLNSIFDDSPLEDQLWARLQQENIPAERQWKERVGRKSYQLDFAIFCSQGGIDVEADGDTWHAQPERIPRDNDRNNALTASGWSVLRFNGQQIRENAAYCTAQIAETIENLGGLDEGLVPRQFHTDGDQTNQQLSLFERGPDYDAADDDIEAWPDDQDL